MYRPGSVPDVPGRARLPPSPGSAKLQLCTRSGRRLVGRPQQSPKRQRGNPSRSRSGRRLVGRPRFRQNRAGEHVRRRCARCSFCTPPYWSTFVIGPSGWGQSGTAVHRTRSGALSRNYSLARRARQPAPGATGGSSASPVGWAWAHRLSLRLRSRRVPLVACPPVLPPSSVTERRLPIAPDASPG